MTDVGHGDRLERYSERCVCEPGDHLACICYVRLLTRNPCDFVNAGGVCSFSPQRTEDCGTCYGLVNIPSQGYYCTGVLIDGSAMSLTFRSGISTYHSWCNSTGCRFSVPFGPVWLWDRLGRPTWRLADARYGLSQDGRWSMTTSRSWIAFSGTKCLAITNGEVKSWNSVPIAVGDDVTPIFFGAGGPSREVTSSEEADNLVDGPRPPPPRLPPTNPHDLAVPP